MWIWIKNAAFCFIVSHIYFLCDHHHASSPKMRATSCSESHHILFLGCTKLNKFNLLSFCSLNKVPTNKLNSEFLNNYHFAKCLGGSSFWMSTYLATVMAASRCALGKKKKNQLFFSKRTILKTSGRTIVHAVLFLTLLLEFKIHSKCKVYPSLFC